MDVEVREVADFLAAHEPWSELDSRLVDELATRMQVRYYRRGTPIMMVGQPNNVVHVLRSGAVDIVDASGQLVERTEPGGSFGASSLLSRAPSRYTITAIEDSLAYVMSADVFHHLHQHHEAVRQFYEQVGETRVRVAASTVRQADRGASAWLGLELGEISAGREPITTSPTSTIRQAAQLMRERNVSALMVVADSLLVGIVTDRDLRNKVVASGLDIALPVSEVMSPRPLTMDPGARAFEALLTMTSRNVRHLPLVSEGRPVGLVSQGDLLRLEQANPLFLIGDIARQNNVAGLAAVNARRAQVVSQLFAQDASADDITHLLTALADATHRRLLELATAELGEAPGRWCWLVLGSQARGELGLSSDQDHAILYEDGIEQAQLGWFEQVAIRVRDGLAECGYAVCDGDVMATNPRWRASQSQWRQYFHRWLNEPEPQAVLHSQIFFDARVAHGDAELFDQVRTETLSMAPQSRRFLAHLAAQAVQRQPPIGFFRGFVLEKEGDHRDTLDLKAGGVHAVIELARVHALNNSISAVGTTERLRALAAQGHLTQQGANDLIDAFLFCSHVRLRHQNRQLASGERSDNFVSPDELSTFEKRHLRDAFGVIRKAQEGLGYLFQTHLVR